MVIRSIQQPGYQRNRETGLPGAVAKRTLAASGKSFDQVLLEAFQGDVVQEGNWTSGQVSSLAQRNLDRMREPVLPFSGLRG